MNLKDATNINPGELLAQVDALKKQGYRFVQVGAAVLSAQGEEAQFELYYSFDLNYDLKNLRVVVPRGTAIPSISKIYLAAFLTENEISEHFGIEITDIAIDFKGTLYKMAVKHPFYLSAVMLKTGAPK